MNAIISQLSAEFDKMEKTIAFQKKVISSIPEQKTPCGCPMMTATAAYPKLRLEDCTWAEIAMYAQSGMADKVFALGDTKEVTLTSGEKIHVRIIGFNHDLNDIDQINPITFETVETLTDDSTMSEKYTNKGGWAECELRKGLNGYFFQNSLPDDLKAVIKSSKKMTGCGGTDPVMGTTVDKLFLLSEQEIFGRKIWSMGGEGHWYDWYRQENTDYWKEKPDGERDWRWERSPFGSDTTGFCFVGSGGGANYDIAGYASGVSFGFCV